MSKKVIVLTNCYPNPYKLYSCMFVKRHVELHRQAGLEVEVLTTGDSRQGKFRSAWKYVVLLFRVLWMALTARFDLVHAHWPFPAGAYALLLSKLRRKPFILTSHGAFVDNLANYPNIITRIVRYVIRQADHIIIVGKAHGKNVSELSGIPIEKMTLIDMGVWLNPNLISQEEARRKLSLPAGEPHITFIGNLIHRKGVDILLNATAELKKMGQNVCVLIGGQGEEQTKLQEQAERLGLQDHVRFVGPIPHDEVYTWFAAGDVCAVPSRREPFGLVPLEAMSSGTAVVATDIGGFRQTVENGVNGTLFPHEDHHALAQALHTLLNNPQQRQSFVEAGHRVAATYDMRHKAAQVKNVYEKHL